MFILMLKKNSQKKENKKDDKENKIHNHWADCRVGNLFDLIKNGMKAFRCSGTLVNARNIGCDRLKVGARRVKT